MKLSFPKMLCGVVVALGTIAAGCGSKRIDLTDPNAVTAEAIAMVERAIPHGRKPNAWPAPLALHAE